jgi:hypothetical protein
MGLYDRHRQLPGLLSSRERLPIYTPPCSNGIVWPSATWLIAVEGLPPHPPTPLPVLMVLYDRQLPAFLSSRERLPIHTPPCSNGIVWPSATWLIAVEGLPPHPPTPLRVLMVLYDRQLPGLLSSRERLSIHAPTCPNGIVWPSATWLIVIKGAPPHPHPSLPCSNWIVWPSATCLIFVKQRFAYAQKNCSIFTQVYLNSDGET